MLRDLLKALCSSMSQQDARNPVLRALREFSEMYSSEDFSDLNVGEILGKRLGIPILNAQTFQEGRVTNLMTPIVHAIGSREGHMG